MSPYVTYKEELSPYCTTCSCTEDNADPVLSGSRPICNFREKLVRITPKNVSAL